jgi:hypothetical protein
MPTTRRASEISIDNLVVRRDFGIQLSSMAINTQAPNQIFPLGRPGIILPAR